MNSISNRVWLILAKVHVLGENPANLKIGSEALVQIFVPATVLEIAMKDADELLRKEGMRSIDILATTSFDGPEDQIESEDSVKKDLIQARKTGLAFTGTFFTSRDSAAFENH